MRKKWNENEGANATKKKRTSLGKCGIYEKYDTKLGILGLI